MSFIKQNFSNYQVGIDGEEYIRDWFKKLGIPFMQADLLFVRNGKWCLGEVKHQEKFKSPPFDGHGLPEWQILRRVKFFDDTGVEPFLIIKDKDDGFIYIRSLIELLKTEYFKTKGRHPRVIFNINEFKKITC